MRMQSMIYTVVQENNFEMRLQAWTCWISFYFSINLFNYARYGTFYLESLKNILQNYPGLKELLSTTGLSVQGQGHYAHRTAIDQRNKKPLTEMQKLQVKFFFSLCMLWINLYNILRFVISLCFAFLHNFVWLDVKNYYNRHIYCTMLSCIVLYYMYKLSVYYYHIFLAKYHYPGKLSIIKQLP